MKHFALPASAIALVSIALANCGASNREANETNGATAVENTTLAKLDLESDGFHNGQPIPAQYTCDGADQSPALKWGEPPPETKSFALILSDPDSPGGPFGHWGAYNIPASARSLQAGQPISAQAVNDFERPGYGGPCPPRGHGPHHYHFKLFALDADKLPLAASARVIDVEKAARRHAIGEGDLIGTYERK